MDNKKNDLENQRLLALKMSDKEKRWNRDKLSSSQKNIVDSARDR